MPAIGSYEYFKCVSVDLRAETGMDKAKKTVAVRATRGGGAN